MLVQPTLSNKGISWQLGSDKVDAPTNSEACLWLRKTNIVILHV